MMTGGTKIDAQTGFTSTGGNSSGRSNTGGTAAMAKIGTQISRNNS